MRHFTQENTHYQFSNKTLGQMNTALLILLGNEGRDEHSLKANINMFSEAILECTEDGMMADEIVDMLQ